MRFHGFPLGKIAGITIQVDWSLAIIFVLVSFGLATGVFPAWHPDWSPGLTWAVALAAAVLFFASVLVHELSHALVGRTRGIPIHRITLFMFGGMAHMEKEPGNWRSELWMAVVGPATSLVLGGFFLLVANLITPANLPRNPGHPEEFFRALGPLATLLSWLGPVNIILGVFNLVPGFPLDGGRVLRAALWARMGDLRRATEAASRVGQGFAWLLMFSGFLMFVGIPVPILGVGVINGLWLAFIGWFLHNAALMSYRQLLVQESLEDVPVTRLMHEELMTIGPTMPVHDLADRLVEERDRRAFPVVEGERLVGLVCVGDLRKVPRNDWPSSTVGDIMTGADDLLTLDSRVDAYEALSKMVRRNVNQAPVLEDGRLVGLVRRDDILRWLSIYGEGHQAYGAHGAHRAP